MLLDFTDVSAILQSLTSTFWDHHPCFLGLPHDELTSESTMYHTKTLPLLSPTTVLGPLVPPKQQNSRATKKDASPGEEEIAQPI